MTPLSGDLSSCPYFRGVGTCDRGCHQEPMCIVDRPSDGWPGERSLGWQLKDAGRARPTPEARQFIVGIALGFALGIAFTFGYLA